MTRTIKYFTAILTFCLLWGCIDETEQNIQEDGELIIVPLTLSASEYEFNGTTKSLLPYIPDAENLIGDIWVVQYSSRGILLPRSIYHYRTSDSGDMVVDDLYYADATTSGVALVESEEDCTVCFIANMGDNIPSEWPDNIYSFKEVMLPVLDADASVNPARLPMCGYYYGPVKHGTKVSASLGRMIARLNIVIDNQTGEDISNLNVALTNTPRYAHIFPVSDKVPLNTAETEASRTHRDTGITLKQWESVNLYYYIAPNLYGEDWPTTLWVTCHLDNTGEDARGGMILGDTVPDASDQSVYPPVQNPERNYMLYPNNNYTFTINLKNLQ